MKSTQGEHCSLHKPVQGKNGGKTWTVPQDHISEETVENTGK